MMAVFSRILAWAAAHERHLGGIAFVFGFGVDLYTFTVLSVAYANLAFLAYLLLAGITVFLGTVFPLTKTYKHHLARIISVLAPLTSQYAIGSLLSGFMIFYAKSADLSVSWPFLLLLAVVFIGNEYFRINYKYLAFQLGLLFFALYAYLIFSIPLVVGRLGPVVFLGGTGASILLFTLYIVALLRTNKSEVARSLRYALPGALTTLLLVIAAYFSGVLPPIPLTMPESGIYHSLTRVEGKYVVMNEYLRPWYQFYIPRTVHVDGNAPLTAYAAVAAPIKFGTYVVHRWEYKDADKHTWVSESQITFPISGGRPGGYRGYSQYVPYKAGQWRVSIETSNGQVIGRIPFLVILTEVPPVLHEETH